MSRYCIRNTNKKYLIRLENDYIFTSKLSFACIFNSLEEAKKYLKSIHNVDMKIVKYALK